MGLVTRILFRSNDENYDWASVVSKNRGYELVGFQQIENTENPRWPKWSFVITYMTT